MLDQQKITIIYCRLSVEDIKEDAKGGKADESNSIQNQKEYLTRYAKDHGYTNLKILVDMLTTSLIQMHPTCTQIAP